jgi:hypothetical protein
MSSKYVLVSGLGWGLIVTTFESLSQPPLELSRSDYVIFYSRILLHFSAAGILLAWLTARASTLRSSLKWIAVVPSLAASMAAALLLDWLSIRFVPVWKNDPMAAMWRLGDLSAYMGWVFAVYGGLYILTFFLLANEAETSERLRLSELARFRAEHRMDRALEEDTAPAVAPDLMLRALSELGHRYDRNDRRADRLLDKLVQLLRSATVSASGGRAVKMHLNNARDLAARLSELHAELDLSGTRSSGSIPLITAEEADHERTRHQ